MFTFFGMGVEYSVSGHLLSGHLPPDIHFLPFTPPDKYPRSIHPLVIYPPRTFTHQTKTGLCGWDMHEC